MNERNNLPALVVLSGGQDSATCLAIALREARHPRVHAVSFDYGQRHRVELECAERLCETWGVAHQTIRVDQLRECVTSALLTKGQDVSVEHPNMRGVPASFVPARNALFFVLAHAIAQEIGAGSIYTGVCQTDYSGYPDCRDHFVTLMEQTMNAGYNANIRFIRPLMEATKAETFAIAYRLGVLDQIIEHTHTCYNGDHDTAHSWGYGCGECPACKLRAAGYKEFMAAMPGFAP